MPIPIGVLAVAGAGAAGGGAYEHIETVNGTGSSGEVVFANIPQTYKHLQVRMVAKSSGTNPISVFMRLNNDSASNYSWHYLYGSGSSVTSASAATQSSMYLGDITGSETNVHGTSIIDILDYSSTSKNTTTRSLNGHYSTAWQAVLLASGSWRDTSAVTIMRIRMNSTSFDTTSRFSLYGIK